MILELLRASAGIGIGVFIGVLLGLSMRKRRGVTSGLLAHSVFLSASAAAGMSMLVMMVITFLSGGVR